MQYSDPCALAAQAERAKSAVLGQIGAGINAAPSELEEIIQHVRRMTAFMSSVGERLREHADAVYGPQPPQGQDGGEAPCRPGLIGTLHDELDSLESVHSFVSAQASRNCGLA